MEHRNSLILATVLVVAAATSFAGTWIAGPGKGSHAVAVSGAAFSDDFTRGDAANLGANWAEPAGDWRIVSNTAVAFDGSYVENLAVYTATACNTVNQYVKVSIPTFAASTYASVAFRYSASGSPLYRVYMWVTEDSTTFTRGATAADGSPQTVQTVAATVVAGDSWGWTCTGTGNSVEIRGWRNPTGNTPTSATNWGGDTTPDVTFTDNPTTPVDTGNNVGIGGEQNSSSGIIFDNFFGGDIP